MAKETKAVTVAPGTKIYTGAGAHPFREGETAILPAEHADDLLKQKVAPPFVPAPAPVAVVEKPTPIKPGT